jgi:hypothetical protein
MAARNNRIMKSEIADTMPVWLANEPILTPVES